MNEEQKYLFDLNGYVVLPDVLSAQQLKECNRELDLLEQTNPVEYPEPFCLGQERTKDNLYISNILEASPVFHNLIDPPNVIDVIAEVTGGPYRLNHTYTIYRWEGGFTGLHMHGTPVIPKCQYRCHNGQMISTLTKVVYPMFDCDEEDGCFAVIPGAHKSNFPKPWDNHPENNPALIPVTARAGDAIIFTEALTHGSTVSRSGRPRRTLYYCYSVGHMPDWGGQGSRNLKFSERIYEDLDEDKRNILMLK